MYYLTQEIQELIASHSIEEHPNECCGMVIENADGYKAIRCDNVARNKKENFRISPVDYLRAGGEGKIRAYYHSHPDDEEGVFSGTDKKVSTGHGVPLIMYCVKNNKFFEHKD
jgi:proteasome lid subunit RPN8/RPN11